MKKIVVNYGPAINDSPQLSASHAVLLEVIAKKYIANLSFRYNFISSGADYNFEISNVETDLAGDIVREINKVKGLCAKVEDVE